MKFKFCRVVSGGMACSTLDQAGRPRIDVGITVAPYESTGTGVMMGSRMPAPGPAGCYPHAGSGRMIACRPAIAPAANFEGDINIDRGARSPTTSPPIIL